MRFLGSLTRNVRRFSFSLPSRVRLREQRPSENEKMISNGAVGNAFIITFFHNKLYLPLFSTYIRVYEVDQNFQTADAELFFGSRRTQNVICPISGTGLSGQKWARKTENLEKKVCWPWESNPDFLAEKYFFLLYTARYRPRTP